MYSDAMSGVDHAWLRMDSDANPMTIVGVMLFDRPLGHAEIASVLESRLLPFDRFRQYVVEQQTGAEWVDDPTFKLENHLREAVLRGAADDAELQRLVGELASEPLDPDRPLWQFHHVTNYRGGSALIARIHHCIADGIALIRVVLALTDETATPARAVPRPRTDRAAAPVDGDGWQGLVRNAATMLPHLLTQAIDPDRLSSYVGGVARMLGDAARLAFLPPDSSSALKGSPAGRKQVAWNAPMPLDELKTVARALGVSVNDVLLCCVAGALRRHLVARGDHLPADAELRTMVPVNLRASGDSLSLGNCFGLVPLSLPVGIENPVARLAELGRRMGELKHGYQAVLAFLLLAAVGRLPRAFEAMVLERFSQRSTAVMTNVPGPREPRYFAGARIERLMFWVPQSGDIGVGISVLSYNDTVQFGVVADQAVCARPEEVVAGFAPEFERLLMCLAMLPGGAIDDCERDSALVESLLAEY